MSQKWKIILGVIILVLIAVGLYSGKLIRDARRYNEYIDKGYELLLNGRHEPALPLFQNAMKIRPYSYDPHYGVGAIYLKQRNLQSAIDELELAVKINPDAVEARYSLGVAYHRMNNYPLALREYEEVLKKKPSVQVYNNVGGIYLEQGKYEEALDFLGKSKN
ncbi:MAG: hypothetical protein A2Y48_02020 [Nitrospirae bacterium RIFCSPLOW2_12_42_9]|nr:MAG: hypothetical protein A2Y48_02020 [Nitrospirae bacterium RIFCSPLOW2_12_42_9]HBI24230.1 hypothetical protein [Nitrospiraceae bacterium]